MDVVREGGKLSPSGKPAPTLGILQGNALKLIVPVNIPPELVLLPAGASGSIGDAGLAVHSLDAPHSFVNHAGELVAVLIASPLPQASLGLL
jgi:hypothetical protein